MAYLRVETQTGTRHVPLDRSRLTIGRLATNDIVLPYQHISRFHAELRRVDDIWWIADLDSTNGLRVAKKRIERCMLTPTVPVQLAPGITLTLVVGDGEEDLTGLPTAYMRVPEPMRTDVRRDQSAKSAHTTPRANPSGADMDPSSMPAPPDATHSQGVTTPTSRHQQQRSYIAPAPMLQPTRTWIGSGTSSADEGSVPEGDLFRRSLWQRDHPLGQQRPAESAPPTTTAGMLHLCQTCGQLTPPDTMYCQGCHQSIARPCPTCGLSLLPVQDRCSRCQSLNPASILRSNRGRTSA